MLSFSMRSTAAAHHRCGRVRAMAEDPMGELDALRVLAERL